MQIQKFIRVTALVLSFSVASLQSSPAHAWLFNFGWGKSAEQANTSKTLALNLTKGMKSDREKVTAIFNWITDNIAYDTAAFQTGQLKSQSADETLQKRKGVCDNFAVLFNEMANSVGVKSTIIQGVTYVRVGDNVQAEHAWNQVIVDGKKWIVDSTWGSGYYDYNTRQFTKRRNTQYLLADPGYLSLTHFEMDKTGKGLPVNRITLEQFKLVKDNTRRLVQIGFESEAVIRALNSSREEMLPLAFEPAEPGIQVVKAPLERQLAGQSTTFAVSHPVGTRVFLSDGQQLREFAGVQPGVSELQATVESHKPLTVIYLPSNSKDPNGYFKLVEYAAR